LIVYKQWTIKAWHVKLGMGMDHKCTSIQCLYKHVESAKSEIIADRSNKDTLCT